MTCDILWALFPTVQLCGTIIMLLQNIICMFSFYLKVLTNKTSKKEKSTQTIKNRFW